MKYIDNVATLTYDSNKCIGCKKCVQVCPHRVFEMDNKKAKLIRINSCIECGACKMNCSVGAINVEAGVGCAQAIISSYIKDHKILNAIFYKTPLTKWYFDKKC